jgi:class 3 adenylate cyclase
VRLPASPVEGKANEALREFLVEQLEISCRDVQIVFGHTSRWKQVKADGTTSDAIDALCPQPDDSLRSNVFFTQEDHCVRAGVAFEMVFLSPGT